MTNLCYKGDLVVKHAHNDYCGYYFNADGEIEEVRGTNYVDVCKQLDKHNAIVREIKQENEEVI